MISPHFASPRESTLAVALQDAGSEHGHFYLDLLPAAGKVTAPADTSAGRSPKTSWPASAAHARHSDSKSAGPDRFGGEGGLIQRLLGGEVIVRGYSLAMVYAEKIATAIARVLSNRWRDLRYLPAYQASPYLR